MIFRIGGFVDGAKSFEPQAAGFHCTHYADPNDLDLAPAPAYIS